MNRAICLSALAVCVLFVACGGGDDPAIVHRMTMEGASMEPTLHDGARLDFWSYDRAIRNGDIVAFYSPVSVNRVFVKRVIGGPGQVVEINSATGEVRVDGVVVEEGYIQGLTECFDTCRFDIPAPSSATIGLPRSAAPIDLTSQDQDQVCLQTPCYFMLGDNRQNSSDSRQGWLLPAQNIVGYWTEPGE